MEQLGNWRKSSHSGGNGGECVEVASLPHAVAIRDSKDPDGGHLVIDRASLRALMAQIKH
ncbi:DUF397 domain-containing protein [Actinomadura fulvescens]|uniref:DUF397 domain-containing protein n=1 Tax=Actinomadura fulvescens TaxID=46160 RepID=A0ABN3QVX1_9ACTN